MFQGSDIVKKKFLYFLNTLNTLVYLKEKIVLHVIQCIKEINYLPFSCFAPQKYESKLV